MAKKKKTAKKKTAKKATRKPSSKKSPATRPGATGKSSAGCLWRGGQRWELGKVPNRFTVRPAPGIHLDDLRQAYGIEPVASLGRQRIAEFEVPRGRCDQTMEKIRGGRICEFASHVYSFSDDPTSRLYLSDDMTIVFDLDVANQSIEDLCAHHGLELVKQLLGLANAYVFRLTPRSRENPLKIADRIRASDKVVECEANVAVRAQSFHRPSDPLLENQWHLHHSGGPFLAENSHIQAENAWEITQGGRSVVVAVADDSCDIKHSEFQGDGKIVAARDFQGLDFNPSPESPGDNHGTACAGLAVAAANRRGVVGVAPECALMPVRTSGFLDDNSIEELFEWVRENGASVISCSWGAASAFFPLSIRQHNALHRAATDGRRGKGCVIVFAAGNANRPVDGSVEERGWPQGLFKGTTRWLSGFAAHQNVVAVSAITSESKKSAYSNWGSEISVCAPSNNGHPGIADPRDPGRGILTFPEIKTPLRGRGIFTTDRVGPAGYSTSDYTGSFGGTSSACPIVAGVAALVLSANPDLSAREVREILEETADKIEDPSVDSQLGQSLGSYNEKGHSPWFGHGRVNAYKAVTEAVNRLGLNEEFFSDVDFGTSEQFDTPAGPTPEDEHETFAEPTPGVLNLPQAQSEIEEDTSSIHPSR